MCPWDALTPGTVRFCEARLCGWVAEPANTWSSLGYVLVGLWLLLQARRTQDSRLVAVAVAEIVIGLGSVLFHGTGALIGEFVDQVGMFLLSCLILTYAWGHARGFAPARVTALYAAAVVASSLAIVVYAPLGIPLFGLQLAAGLLWELGHRQRSHHRPQYRPLVQGILIFLVAFAIWVTDITGVLCDPDNHWLTGHAVWHLLNALSIERIYRFYAGRGPTEAPSPTAAGG